MRVVYIAGRYRGADAWEVERNIRKAEELAYAVAECGAMPLCPHTNTRFFNDTLDAQFWLDGTLELMRRCDAVMFTDDWQLSAGARGEHEEAERLNLPRIYSLATLKAWLNYDEAA